MSGVRVVVVVVFCVFELKSCTPKIYENMHFCSVYMVFGDELKKSLKNKANSSVPLVHMPFSLIDVGQCFCSIFHPKCNLFECLLAQHKKSTLNTGYNIINDVSVYVKVSGKFPFFPGVICDVGCVLYIGCTMHWWHQHRKLHALGCSLTTAAAAADAVAVAIATQCICVRCTLT